MSEAKIKRIPKAEVEKKQAEREIQSALGNLRRNAQKFPEKVEQGIRDIARQLGVVIS